MKKLLTPTEVADILGISEGRKSARINAMVRRGDLVAVRISPRILRIHPDSLEQFIRDRSTNDLRPSQELLLK